MLDPEYLNSLPEPLLELYDELEDWIISDIARRLKEYEEVTRTAEHQTELLRALDLTQEEINKRIAETLDKSQEEVERLFDEAMEKSSSFIEERLPSLPTDGSFKKQLLANAITVSEGNLRNLTRTAGFISNFGKYSPLTTSYRDALSLAGLQVSTGATDYNTAIRNALKPFTDRGIVSITYDKDGKIRRRSIEAAVRQCVMQGARDMSKAYMEQVAEDIGADGREISAHLNCAPDHQPYQGRQYSNKKYEELNETLARPIGTYNCRHMAFPIILGVSEPAHSEQELEDLKAENDKGVTYEGKPYTLYEASQQQRKLERSIRKCKRELIVADELGDKSDFTAKSIRLRRLTGYYNDFSDKCRLTKRRELMSVGGYGRKVSRRASEAEKKVFVKIENSIRIKDNKESESVISNPDVKNICKLDIEKYKRITNKTIQTNDVVITTKCKEHIIERRGMDFYERYGDEFATVVLEPDYIFADKENTALVCKRFEDANKYINLVIRLVVEGDNPEYKNSIITAIMENERRFKQRLRNNKYVYKKE